MTIDKTAILDAFAFRHACKEFDGERRIPDAEFQLILEVARLSPSSFGLEPWQFLVVQDPQLRESLREHTWGGQKQLPTASHLILALVRKSHFMRYDSDYVQNFMREVQHFPEDAAQARTALLAKFQREDFRLFDCERSMTDWAAKQTYIALANMMTVAAMRGIDSCPIEGFDLAAVERVVADQMAVDLSQWSVSYMVAFGYRKTAPARPKTRQPLDKVVRWF